MADEHKASGRTPIDKCAFLCDYALYSVTSETMFVAIHIMRTQRRGATIAPHLNRDWLSFPARSAGKDLRRATDNAELCMSWMTHGLLPIETAPTPSPTQAATTRP